MSTVVTVSGLSYCGDHLADFVETETSDIGVDDYGINSLQRTFMGRPDLFDAFIAKYRRRVTQDAQYPHMIFEDFSAPKGRSWTTVTLNFYGSTARNGAFPPETLTPGWARESVQVTSGLTGQQATFTYRSPTMTIKYARLARPQGPEFVGFMGKFNGKIQITGRTGSALSLLDITIQPQVQIITDDFQPVQKGGAWQCEVKNHAVLIAQGQTLTIVPHTLAADKTAEYKLGNNP